RLRGIDVIAHLLESGRQTLTASLDPPDVSRHPWHILQGGRGCDRAQAVQVVGVFNFHHAENNFFMRKTQTDAHPCQGKRLRKARNTTRLGYARINGNDEAPSLSAKST